MNGISDSSFANTQDALMQAGTPTVPAERKAGGDSLPGVSSNVAQRVFTMVLLMATHQSAWALDESYEFTIAAQTGMFVPTGESPPLDYGALTKLGSPSINFYGVTAFKGDVGNVDGGWIYIPWTGEVRKETASLTNGDNYFWDVQINDSGWISTLRQSGNSWWAELWNGQNSTTIISNNNNASVYTSIFSPAVSNQSVQPGGNAFNAAVGVTSLSFPYPSVAGLITPIDLGVEVFNELHAASVAGGPRIAEDGRSIAVIYFNSAWRLMRFNYDFSHWSEVAATDLQYSDYIYIGSKPGLSDNGKAVGFAAILDDSETQVVMLSIEKDDGTPHLVQVAGLRPEEPWRSELGYDAAGNPLFLEEISYEMRVGVIHQELGAAGLADDSFVLHFIATPNAASDSEFFTPGMEFTNRRGLWTVQVDVIGIDESGEVKTRVHRPIAVAQFGDKAEDFGLPEEWNWDTSVNPPVFVGAGISADDALARQDWYQTPGDLSLSPVASRSLEAGNHRLAFRLGFPGGAAIVTARRVGACMLPVRRQPQGGNQPWASAQLDSHQCFTGQSRAGTIGARGCVVTTLTMQLTHAAENLLERGEISGIEYSDLVAEDPLSTNLFWDSVPTAFTRANDCSDGTGGAGLVRTTAVNTYHDEQLPATTRLYWNPAGEMGNYDLPQDVRNELYDRLCVDRAPVAIRVPSPGSARLNGHDVLVTGVVNDQFHIADPASSCGQSCAGVQQSPAKRLLDYTFPYKLKGSIFDGNGGSVRGSHGRQAVGSDFVTLASIQDLLLSVTDSAGRVTGFLSETPGDFIADIPGSAVSDDVNSDPEGELADEAPLREIYIEGPDVPLYDLEAVGLAQGPFSISVYSQLGGDEAQVEATSVEGFMAPGLPTQISLDFTGGGVVGSVVSTPTPDTVGQLVWDAENAVLSAGLNVGNVVYQHDTSVPGYTVIGQQPTALSVASGGTPVDLFVANGPDSDGDGWSDISDNCIDKSNSGQRDSDGDGIGNACDPDIAQPNDCQVNFADLGVLKTAFFSVDGDANWNADADFDGDGRVNFTDLGIIKAGFFGPPGPTGLSNSCE